MPTDGLGALAAALAKAQSQFPTIPRDKEVTVKSQRTGNSYTFKYAPLDTILAATRKALAENGLAIAQLLDEGDLVTMLLHESGGVLSGHLTIPVGENSTVQELGSAITYLRRYSLQAMLGIAAEEDDDGNRASGNIATPRRAPDPHPSQVDRETGEIRTIADAEAQPFPATVEGKVAFSNKAPVDGNYRQTPEGLMYGFVVEAEGGKRLQVVATHLAEALQTIGAPIKGQWVTVEGLIERIAWKKDGRDMPAYQRMTLSRIVTPEYTLPAPKGLAPEDLAELETLPWPDSLPEVPA